MYIGWTGLSFLTSPSLPDLHISGGGEGQTSQPPFLGGGGGWASQPPYLDGGEGKASRSPRLNGGKG